MNAQQLKKSILKYAIEGKLVNQDTSDEPASELLKRIFEQKEQMVKEKIIKKEKTLPPITEEETPFNIPDTWEWVRIGDIGPWRAGSTPNRSNPSYYSGDIPWVKTGELNDGYIDGSNEFISASALKECSLPLNKPGSVLIAMYGATIGKVGILNISATTNQACCASYPFEGIYNKYLLYYLLSMRNHFRSSAAGGAQPNISKEKLIKTLIPLPPTREQIKIVDKIEELFLKIDSYDTHYSALEALNKRSPKDLEKSILQYAIQGKLVNQDTSDEAASELLKRIFKQREQMVKENIIKKEKSLPPITEEEIPFDIPDTWEWVRLKSVGIITSGGTPKTAVPEYWNGEITWITPSDMGKNKNSKYLSTSDRAITLQGLSNSSAQLIPENSIVYSSRAPIGHINIMTTNYATNQGCKSFSPILVDVEYIYYVLKVMTPYLQKKASGTTFKEISGTTFGSSLVPLPPLLEQSRIVKAIEKNKNVLERLKTTQSL